MLRSSREDNINQLKCKNKKLHRLISQKPVNRDNSQLTYTCSKSTIETPEKGVR